MYLAHQMRCKNEERSRQNVDEGILDSEPETCELLDEAGNGCTSYNKLKAIIACEHGKNQNQQGAWGMNVIRATMQRKKKLICTANSN